VKIQQQTVGIIPLEPDDRKATYLDRNGNVDIEVAAYDRDQSTPHPAEMAGDRGGTPQSLEVAKLRCGERAGVRLSVVLETHRDHAVDLVMMA
jgi:hypothetical protein